MGNNRSPGSQHEPWRHHSLQCTKAGNSEFETVTRNLFKNLRSYASSSYMKVLKRSEQKLQRKPDESIVFRRSMAAYYVVSDRI